MPPRKRSPSAWYSTPQAARTNRKVGLTLPPEAIERLDELAAERGTSKSEVVADLILRAKG